MKSHDFDFYLYVLENDAVAVVHRHLLQDFSAGDDDVDFHNLFLQVLHLSTKTLNRHYPSHHFENLDVDLDTYYSLDVMDDDGDHDDVLLHVRVVSTFHFRHYQNPHHDDHHNNFHHHKNYYHYYFDSYFVDHITFFDFVLLQLFLNLYLKMLYNNSHKNYLVCLDLCIF